MDNLNELTTRTIGKSIKQLDLEEMHEIYGGIDPNPRSTILCTAGASFIASYLASAAFNCGKDNK